MKDKNTIIMKKVICLVICLISLCHAQEPAAQQPGPKKFPEDVLQTPPVVFAVGHDYQIMVPVVTEAMVSCEINGKTYYDANNGVINTATRVRRMTVPQAELNAAKEYTLCCRVVKKRAEYYTKTEPLQKKTYAFRPLEKTENIKIFMLPDTHDHVKASIAAAQYFGKELDLLILNGDISEGLSGYNNIAQIYKIAGGVTNGEIPVVYARGNHELRGAMAEQLPLYAPVRDGYFYYTFRLGPVWGIVLDCGEDKDDGHAEYGHAVACHDFRVKETEYLKRVIANAASEYDAADVKYRLIVCHVPFMHINNKPFDIELDIYREWCKLLRENVKPQLMLCGHFHTIRVVRPGHAWDNLGEPCPVVIGSRPGGSMDDYTGTAIEMSVQKAAIHFVHSTLKIQGEDVIEFK